MKTKFLALPFALLLFSAVSTAYAVEPVLPGNFDLKALGTNDDYSVTVKTNKVTGEAWYKSGDNWVATTTNTTLPAANYKFKIVIYKNSGWGLVRLDTVSGNAWVLDGSTWKEILPPTTQQQVTPQQTTPQQMQQQMQQQTSPQQTQQY